MERIIQEETVLGLDESVRGDLEGPVSWMGLGGARGRGASDGGDQHS